MFTLSPARPLRPSSNRAARPALEGLEDRLLLYAASGGHWTYGNRITYSFVPDGTTLGNIPSTLNQRLNAEGISTAAWQQAIAQAASTWEAVANIQLAQVFDDGSPIGTFGNQQDDPRFGDIRIGGFSQNNGGQLAFAFLPPAFNGGTSAGDIFFNTDQPWQVNGSAYDLETVAIHEIGHALGMNHSQVQTAEMYGYYNGTKPYLDPDDVQGISSIYGPAQPDTDSNGTYATAVDITPYLSPSGQLTIGNLRIAAGNNDVDWFYVTTPSVPSPSGQLNVTIQAAGLSSLVPRLVIYNQSRTQILANAYTPNTYGVGIANAGVNAAPGQGFYIRCQAGQADSGGSGAYGLKINFASTAIPPVAPPNTVVAWQPDAGGGGVSDRTAPSAPGTSYSITPIFGTGGLPSGPIGLLGGLFSNLKADGPLGILSGIASRLASTIDSPALFRAGALTGYVDELSIKAPAKASPWHLPRGARVIGQAQDPTPHHPSGATHGHPGHRPGQAHRASS